MQRVVHLCPVHCPPVVELCRQRPIAVALENESKIDITTRCHWPTVGFEGSFGAFDAHWTRQGRFQDPSDYCFFLLIEMLLISAISSGLAWPTGLPFNGPSLTFAVVYYWSRCEPEARLSVYGFSIPGYQFPFFLLGFTLLMGGDIWGDLVGLTAAHSYHFLRDIVPVESAQRRSAR